MFSSQNAKQADMCRFCWMCRHICPVAGATGSEGWGPRARGLMVSMIERGTPYDAEIADAMYHCTMCDACANDCVTGWRPTDFIREARTLAVVNEIAPTAVTREIENILSCGCIYGEPTDPLLQAAVEKLPETADVLLYLGQSARCRVPGSALAMMELLAKAGVSYTVLRDEPPSGAFLGDLMGFTGDVQAVAKKAAAAIRSSAAKTLVAFAPYDCVMLHDQYAHWELLDGVEVVSAPAFLAGLIADGRLSPAPVSLRASLQEPVKLTRGLDEIRPLAEVVEALGIELLPLYLNGKMSRCVGTPLMECLDPTVVRRMVGVRLDDARRIGSDTIITASPDDFDLMSRYAREDVRILDLFRLLAESC